MAQLVAHHTGSVGVTGSNPVSSTFNPRFTCWTWGFSLFYLFFTRSLDGIRGGWVGLKMVLFGMNLAIFHAKIDYSNMEV